MTTTRHRHNPTPPPADLWSTLALVLASTVMGWLVVLWLCQPYELSPHVPDDVPAVRP